MAATSNDELMKDPIFRRISGYSSCIYGLGGVAEYDEFSYSGRQLKTVYGRHGSLRAMQLAHDRILPDASKNPKDWLFLIELSGDVLRKPKGKREFRESTYMVEISEEHGIPFADPIVSPLSSTVREEAIKRGYDSLKVLDAMTILYADSVLHGIGSVKYFSDTYSGSIGVPVDEFASSIWRNQQRILYWHQDIDEIYDIFKWPLMEISTELSTHLLDAQLQMHDDRHGVALLMGLAHLPILNHARGGERFRHRIGERQIKYPSKNQ